MAHMFAFTSSLTAKGQTTIPKPVRDALRLGPGDTITFRIEDGMVSLTSTAAQDDDPVVAAFLAFLEKDLQNHPENILPLPDGFQALADKLAELGPVDFDENLDDDAINNF